MEKLLRVAELRDLESQVSTGKISYSRMVEIINEKHFMKLVELRQSLKPKKVKGEFEKPFMEDILEKVGFKHMTGTLWKHEAIGIISVDKDVADGFGLVVCIHARGYGQAQLDVRTALGITK